MGCAEPTARASLVRECRCAVQIGCSGPIGNVPWELFMMLRDFCCTECQLTFEAVADGEGLSHPCPRCGKTVNYVMTFRGSIKAGGPMVDKSLWKETSPGKDLSRPWQQDREFTTTRDTTKKLPDGRKVRRISLDVSDNVQPRDLNPNLIKDIERKAKK